MKKYLLTFVLFFETIILIAQSKPAYVLYNAKGKKVTYKKMIKQLIEKDVVLFGEFHNNPISHWLELSVAKDLAGKKAITFGAETPT